MNDTTTKTTTDASPPQPTVKMVIELNQPEVHGYTTPDEGGSDSEEETLQHGKTRKDFQPTTPATVSDTSSLNSTPSTLSEILDPNDQAYILSITARIKANMEHADRAREATGNPAGPGYDSDGGHDIPLPSQNTQAGQRHATCS